MARAAGLNTHFRAQNTCRHAAFCRAAAVTCREALKMCGRCAARLAAMPSLSKYFEIGGKVHVKLTTNHNIYFHFYMHDGSVPPKFACKSWISQLHELIARWQRKRLSPPGDQNMHRLQLFSTPWKLCSVVNTNTCRKKKENVNGA